MADDRTLRLVMQYLSDGGYSESLQVLERESGRAFEAEGSGMANELCTIVEDADDLARITSGMSRVGVSCEDERQLEVPGDGAFYAVATARVNDVHASNILCVASGVEWVATGAVDRTLRLTDCRTHSLIWRSQPRRGSILSVDVHPQDRTLLITGDMSGDTVLTRAVIEDGMVCEPAAGSGVACEAEPLATFSDHTKYVVRARWSPDGQCFATASYDKTVCLYGSERTEGQTSATTTDNWKLQHRWTFSGNVECIVFWGNTTIVASIRDSNMLRYIDCASRDITDINMNPNQDDWVSFTAMDLAISPDGTYLLVASDKSKLLLYKLGGSEQLRRFYGAENDMYSNPRCTWHPSGLYVYCTAQDNNVHVWEVATQKRIAQLEGHTKCVRGLSTMPEGGLVTCSYDSSVTLWGHNVTA